jgi:hypothetical protein
VCVAAVAAVAPLIIPSRRSKLGDATAEIDILAMVRTMRQSRRYMVQTAAQYRFCYQAIQRGTALYLDGKRMGAAAPAAPAAPVPVTAPAALPPPVAAAPAATPAPVLVPDADVPALRLENSRLRAQVAQLSFANEQLASEKAALAAEVERLRTRVAAAPAAPAPSSWTKSGDDDDDDVERRLRDRAARPSHALRVRPSAKKGW